MHPSRPPPQGDKLKQSRKFVEVHEGIQYRILFHTWYKQAWEGGSFARKRKCIERGRKPEGTMHEGEQGTVQEYAGIEPN